MATKIKSYNAKKRVSPQLRAEIESTIETNEGFKACFWWNRDNGNVSYREWLENRFYRDNPDYIILTDDHEIQVKPRINYRRKAVHYNLEILKDGKKSNIKVLKSLIRR